MTQWHYTKMGLQQGPVPEDELRTKIRRGEIGDSTLVWREGMAEWLSLAQVSELQTDAPKVEPKSEGPPQMVRPEQMTMPVNPLPQKDIGNIQLPQPQAYQGDYVAPNIQTYMVPSIVATVLSALSMLVCCLAPGIITGIVAIVYASKVDSLKVQGEYIGAASASQTAKVWMIVTYSLLGMVVITGVVLMIIGSLG
ncbi:MAG: GYF domain-containing protein [Luteolibacter sp.]